MEGAAYASLLGGPPAAFDLFVDLTFGPALRRKLDSRHDGAVQIIELVWRLLRRPFSRHLQSAQ